MNIEIPKSNQVRFGKKSLRYLGPKAWNSLPYHIKYSENLTIFKTVKQFGIEQFVHERYAKSETIQLRLYFLVSTLFVHICQF